MASSSKVKSENKKTQLDTVFSHLICNLTFLSFTVDYKAIVCILILADVDVIVRIKKAAKILFMNKFLTNCLMLLFYFLAFDWMILPYEHWSLAMLPPIEKVNAETDIDSDVSDDLMMVRYTICQGAY